MTDNLFTNGARLVWRHQRLMWWIFIVNLALGWLTRGPVKGAFGEVLDHSMASGRLVNHFDLGALGDLARVPSIAGSLHTFWAFSMHFALVFLIFMVFINGGVLTVYREDRKLPRAEFFEMAGAYFWRMVRLVLISLIPFAICAGIFGAISDWSDTLSNDAPNAKTGFYVLIAGIVVMWVIAMFVRLWFDLAQSLTVAGNERGMFRMTWRGLVRSLRNISPLLTTYLSIHVVGILAMILLCFAWLYTPGRSLVLNFLLLEILLLVEIFVRLWQKASCMSWVEMHTVVIATPAYELISTAASPTPIIPDFPETGPATDVPPGI